MSAPKDSVPGIPANDFLKNLAVRLESDADQEWIEALHALCFGPGRFARTAFRVRERIDPDPRYCFCAETGGRPISSVKMTPIAVGGVPGYLLGPLATDPAFRNRGAGRVLVRRATEAAMSDGTTRFVLLVGDEPYYGPLGFRRTVRGAVPFPGPVDPDRVLVHCDDALIAGLAGPVGARSHRSGAPPPADDRHQRAD
ncbi:MAG TPA: N-acetyltransferase [Devosiaceae bacterium]|nr:N-acetyltransferase [Devosiaceae bacterium]